MIKKIISKAIGIDKLQKEANRQLSDLQHELQEETNRQLIEAKKKFDDELAKIQADAESQLAEANAKIEEAHRLSDQADTVVKKAETKMLSAKDKATAKGEPYINVIETHIKKNNARNGFFELDWNPIFVEQLRMEGYGFEGDPEEEIVDRWFRELCLSVASNEQIDMTNRNAGSVQLAVRRIDDETLEVS